MFYITRSHYNINNNNNPKVYHNIGDIRSNVHEFSSFKTKLINTSYDNLQRFYAKDIDYFLKNNFYFLLQNGLITQKFFPGIKFMMILILNIISLIHKMFQINYYISKIWEKNAGINI